MTSPIAVLLIIGSAVVGPIEAQVVGDAAKAEQACYDAYTSKNPISEYDAVRQRIIRSWRDACPAEKFAKTLETLPQLCERAMQEIGAGPNENTAAVEPYKSMWYLLRVTSGVASKGFDVLCIPVPQGYRK